MDFANARKEYLKIEDVNADALLQKIYQRAFDLYAELAQEGCSISAEKLLQFEKVEDFLQVDYVALALFQ